MKITQADTSERHYFEELREKSFEKAIADGKEIVIPTSYQLALDIDRPWPMDLPPFTISRPLVREIIHQRNPKLISTVYRLDKEFVITRHEAWRSTGGNCHVLLTLANDLDLLSRIALQAILGSDPMRELLNLRRALCSADDPIALFRPSPDVAQNAAAPTSKCPTCGEPQFECPSGLTCENGHGY